VLVRPLVVKGQLAGNSGPGIDPIRDTFYNF